MFTVLIPAYTRGGRRRRNPEYVTVQNAIARARKQRDHAAVRQLRRLQRQLPSGDPQDPGYRRLRYSRYADDVLFGLIGPRAEAEEIKQRLTEFLRDDLRLDLNQAKTLITHARTGAAKFLGYEITVQHGDQTPRRGRRAVNGVVRLRAPTTVIKAKSAPYLQHGKPERRTKLLTFDDHTIVSTYGAEYRGIVQYYLLAGDVYRLGRLHWVMQTSLLKTLAAKHRCAVTRTARKHRSKIQTPHGPRTCIQVSVSRGDGRRPLVARFGGIPLIRQHTAVHHRPRTRPAGRPPQGADHPAPGRHLRTLPTTSGHPGPPRPQTRRPDNGATATPRVDDHYGQTAPQDPRGL